MPCTSPIPRKLILSLCDYSGRWPKYYAEDPAYEVISVDLKSGGDVCLYQFLGREVYGILAAPPCTHFSRSGAQYWHAKDADGRTREALAIVDACLRMVAIYKPHFWALENPSGRLKNWLGPPRCKFNPCDYAGYGSEEDRYTKKTCLWGDFTVPEKQYQEPIRACKQGSWLQKLGGSSERTKTLRSMTPLGFSKAFYEANQ